YAIAPNFPPGKLPGKPDYTDVYYNMSQGEGDMDGPWNSGANWKRVDDREEQQAVDGGDGLATLRLNEDAAGVLEQPAARTRSDPSADPTTGAELGAGPGAGAVSPDGGRGKAH